jgi:hypothetical protein
MLQLAQRIRFANFLERLATVGVTIDDWQHYMLTHYTDEIMEKARNLIVKLTLYCSFEENFVGCSRWLRIADIEVYHQIKIIAVDLINADKNLLI